MSRGKDAFYKKKLKNDFDNVVITKLIGDEDEPFSCEKMEDNFRRALQIKSLVDRLSK